MRRQPMDWTVRRFRTAIVVLAVLAGIVVYVIGHEVFPYFSVNHDEGVYLQQAAMLLQGNLWLTNDLPEVFRPWFFIQDGRRLYSKYTPVAALLFAPGVALGVPRFSLSVIAAGNIALVGLIGSEAFDRSTGLLAAVIALASPLFLFVSATFMSYAPTTLLNLIFALCYIRMYRQRSRRYAVIAGAAIGMAFFSRPYTAVLFATPFVVHALVIVVLTVHQRNIWTPTIEREAIVALFGLTGAGIALAYNKMMTGDPFLFPYQVFAPLDGLGFGFRRMTGSGLEYTVELALQANNQLVTELLTQWTFAAPIGSVLAVIGLFPVVLRYRERHDASLLSDRALRVVLVGVFGTICVGNIYFWGTVKILENIADPTDGLIGLLGPYYHLDLVLPLSVFASAGILWLSRVIRSVVSVSVSTRAARVMISVLLVVSVPVLASAEYTRVEPVIERNMEYTEQYAEVYAPFEIQSFEHALVFLPVPYGPWLGHPFQSLRNGGSLEQSPVLYAQNRGPTKEFATIDAYPTRTLYRFTYQGIWGDGSGQHLVPHLQRLTVRNGTDHRLTTTVGTVGRVSSVRLSVGDEQIVRHNPAPDTITERSVAVQWEVNGTHVRLVDTRSAQGPMTDTSTRRSPVTDRAVAPPVPEEMHTDAIAIDGPVDASLAITVTKPTGKTVTYRQKLAIDANNESARLLWPGSTKLCQESRTCGREGNYIPGGTYPDGTSMNTTVQTFERI